MGLECATSSPDNIHKHKHQRIVSCQRGGEEHLQSDVGATYPLPKSCLAYGSYDKFRDILERCAICVFFKWIHVICKEENIDYILYVCIVYIYYVYVNTHTAYILKIFTCIFFY